MQLSEETEQIMADIAEVGNDLKEDLVYNRVSGHIERLVQKAKQAHKIMAGMMPAE